jgi:hypothetical protein
MGNCYLTPEAMDASDEDPAVIRKILAHLDDNATSAASTNIQES